LEETENLDLSKNKQFFAFAKKLRMNITFNRRLSKCFFRKIHFTIGMKFFKTFRGRLLLILALLLVATLGFQYYLNLVTQNQSDELREAQEQSVVAGIALGISSLTKAEERVQDLIDEPGQSFLDARSRER